MPRRLSIAIALGFVALAFGLRSRIVSIRVARTDKDYECVISHKYKFLARSSPNAHEIEYVKQWMMDARTLCLMAETVDGAEFAGSIEMRPMDDSYAHFMLQNLVVNPTLRRIGVATTLMDTIDKFLTGKLGDYPLSPWIKESSEVVAHYHYAWMTHFKGLPPRIILELHVSPENLPAIDLYKKTGYVIQPTTRLPFFSIGLHKMVKYVANSPEMQNVDASSSASLAGKEGGLRKLQSFM